METRSGLLSFKTAKHKTITDALEQAAVSQSEKTAFYVLDKDGDFQPIDYKSLYERVQTLAVELSREASPGDRVLLLYPFGLDFITGFMACLYSRLIAVPAYPPRRNRNATRLATMMEDCQPSILLCNSETESTVNENLSATAFRRTTLNTEKVTTSTVSDPEYLHLSIESRDVAFLQYTSGSTRSPKGVVVSHENIVANVALIQRHCKFDPECTMVSWLPLFHDMGLFGGILAPLFVGFPSVLLSPSTFLKRPASWLEAISRFRGTVTGAPNFAYDLCVKRITPDQKRSLDLSSLRVAYNGAENVRPSTLNAFSSYFSDCGFDSKAFFPCYGLAESTVFVSGGPPGNSRNFAKPKSRHSIGLDSNKTDKQHEWVSCGLVGADLEVIIVQPETGFALGDLEVGEIWVRGSSVAKGYWNSPKETEEVFGGKQDGIQHRYLRTGDLGFLCKDELYVTGRLKDIIIVNGKNIYPSDIEELLERHFDFIEPNKCAAFAVNLGEKEEVVAVAEGSRELVQVMRNNNPPTQRVETESILVKKCENLIEEVLLEFDVSMRAIFFIRPNSFPRTSSGKVQRSLARKQLQKGEFEVVWNYAANQKSDTRSYSGTTEHVPLDVHKIVFSTLRIWCNENEQEFQSLQEETKFSSLGIDSIAVMELVERLEPQLCIPLDGDDFRKYRTLGEFVHGIRERIYAQRKY